MAPTTKDALACWNSGHDESVEVNQRALIDKVLARYSGEFTVFRELLQNSDDASSKAVEIRFETKRYIDRNNSDDHQAPPLFDERLPDLKTALVHRWTFKNNGILFRDEDWNRLKKIAEGNPDEEKIGAFGVGFYSLFSVTEEPFVTSGGQWMGFYWKDKKDQLFARRGYLPDKTDDPWTTFEMDLREPTPIPAAFDFTRFLVSSITFMAHLREVSMYFDDKRLVHLTKDAGIPKQLTIPRGLRPTSTMGFMTVKGLKSTPLHITAEVMNWVYSTGTEKPKPVPIIEQIKSKTGFFSSLFGLSGGSTPQRAPSPLPQLAITEAEYLKVGQSTVVLAIFTAEVDVKLSQKISVELHRSTKKNPPRALKYELIYTGKDEYDASKKEDDTQPKATGTIFQGLRADLDGSGSAHVFIGHATAQTTGLGGHMAARFIPTVERESIDLVDRNVAVWNKELLFVGGFLARTAYELEMQDMRTYWDASLALKKPGEPIDPEVRKVFYGRASHNLRFFTFHPSTPSAVVSSEMRSAFFNCINRGQSFPVVSSAGIKPAVDVRMPDPTFSGFLRQLPVFPEELLDGSKLMVAALREKGMLKDITFVDVLKELRERPLSEEEMVGCLQWWINTSQQDPTGINDIRRELLSAAVLSVGSSDDGSERIIPLGGIQTFLNPRNVAFPTDGPFPGHLLPITISRKFDLTQLQKSLQWRELTVLEWVQHIVDPAVYTRGGEFNIVESPDWADRVLQVLSRCWPTLSNVNQTSVVGLLDKLACIPTSAGMKTPSEAYFSNADIFKDLPVVSLPSGVQIRGNLERVLTDLGVRKHVDLQVIFNRMIKTGDWTIPDLIKYLVSVQSTLQPLEIERLRLTPAFPEEATARQNKDEDGTPKKVPKFKASDLYEPSDVFRSLGLPVIDWQGKDDKHKWKSNSEEAKFLFNLGLRRHPPTEVILSIAAKDEPQRGVALNYFLDHYMQKYTDYTADAHANIAFVPAIHKGDKKLAKPLEVFSNPDWQLLGFPVLDPTLRQDAVNKLKIKEHPPTNHLVRFLEASPPTTEAQAREWFGVLSRRVSDFQPSELTKLSAMCIVPIPDNFPESQGPRLLPPNQCYFKTESSGQFHSKLFVFVDFGTSANSFLKACGTKGEPSVDEIVQLLLKNPRQFLQLAESWDNYLVELRNIAINFYLLGYATSARLRKAAILVGSRRVRRQKSEKATDSVDGDEEDWDPEYDLLAPNQIAIVDDMIALQQFGEVIFCAPQEDILEGEYGNMFPWYFTSALEIIGFYRSLGCKRLSDLVREECRKTQEIRGHKTAQEIRSLVLERLPLFLHEHTHATTRVHFTWLNNERNFVVRAFGKLTVTRSLNFAGTQSSKTIETSAIAKREGKGEIQLWLAGNAQVDMYEVATSLCRLLFDTHRVSDALLFTTILSMDLRALRRRGYNVDRILKQQKAEREAIAEALAKEKANKIALVSPPPISPKPEFVPIPAPLPTPAPLLAPVPVLAPAPIQTPTPGPEHAGNIDADQLSATPKAGPLADDDFKGRPKLSLIDGFRQKIQSKPQLPTFSDRGPPVPEKPITDLVTPLINIASNIDTAIKACREDKGDLIQSRKQMKMVKETFNDGYCDISGNIGDLTLLGGMGEVKLYSAKDVPNPAELFKVKKDAIARFIHVIMPIRDLYQLPPTSVHIFYDLAGGTIAFNRNASIFLNLRYYEAWHDDLVRNGSLAEAYTSWYFSLAHEIAHNLVQPHNSEHEFYFSSICEKFLPGLSKLTLAEK
ncbi:hypothetical protein BDM02DRAFT_3272450 [Thelephora ganbajun]|uniref:Uncharacterized protein n=1 Tax=Thelephora ganbajun TaxID=370292 RepID=A0ACB6Z544_THEGA|nr:hypothetical protein BDM02DRAFT_3272450 [Thelephora ganbajun]